MAGLTAKKAFPWPSDAELEQAPERRIAILVPLWREHGVIRQMLDHNLWRRSATRNYDVFMGVYPNDQPTLQAVSEEAERQHARVHLALARTTGPPVEGRLPEHDPALHGGVRRVARASVFETVVTHDAEDLIHPDSLPLINWFCADYDMVQVPVLPLPTAPANSRTGCIATNSPSTSRKTFRCARSWADFCPRTAWARDSDRDALEPICGAARRPHVRPRMPDRRLRVRATGCT